MNASFNDSQGGAYHLNISVSDTTGLIDYGDFWVFVYDLPKITFPGDGFIFNLEEGKTSNLTFRANSTGLSNLSYQFYINGDLRYDISYYGDNTPIIWQAVPKFMDEGYGLFGNLSLIVLIPSFEYLNTTMIWNVNISHGDAPVEFIKNIGDKQGTFGKSIDINLTEHFSDADVFDVHYNQSVSFSARSSTNTSAISYSVSNWLLSFSSSSLSTDIFNITGMDSSKNNATSNNFEVKFTEPQKIEVPKPVPVPVGGSSGSNTEKPVSLKIIVPSPISRQEGGVVIIPITLLNDGPVSLQDISLSSIIAKDGERRDDLKTSFDRESLSGLSIGQKENVTLTVELGNELGLYEVTVNARVRSPNYNDWSKIFINVGEGETIVERLVFTEEFIVENPECLELQELVDESREYLTAGDIPKAESKLNDAINSCKEAISQNSLFSKNRIKAKFQDKIFLYLLFASIFAVALGITYYIYRRMVLKKALEEISEIGDS